jgi:RimJ/RimL family protein N-acetyltransferase
VTLLGATCTVLWTVGGDRLIAREEPDSVIRACAGQLASWYNETYNSGMMGHESPISADEVCAQAGVMRSEGSRYFLLYLGEEFMGDADFRNIQQSEAEFAIMIGARTQQGKGLGTRFSVMMHAFAFRELSVATCYLTIVPQNVAGRRCYEKVGYRVDEGPAARHYIDEDTDVAMSLSRSVFEERHRDALREIVVHARGEGA